MTQPNPTPTPAETSDTDVPCRVVVCDDAYEFVRLLELVFGIEPDLDVVGTAADGQEAITVCGELRPDVLLLDIAMPVLDGIAALPDILRASPATRVVVLTGFASSEVERRAMDAGASAFALKGTPPNDLIALVRRVHADRVATAEHAP